MRVLMLALPSMQVGIKTLTGRKVAQDPLQVSLLAVCCSATCYIHLLGLPAWYLLLQLACQCWCWLHDVACCRRLLCRRSAWCRRRPTLLCWLHDALRRGARLQAALPQPLPSHSRVTSRRHPPRPIARPSCLVA